MVVGTAGYCYRFLYRNLSHCYSDVCKWPSTFIPEEDDGYFMIAIQLPAASSLERTQMVGKQIDAICQSIPK